MDGAQPALEKASPSPPRLRIRSRWVEPPLDEAAAQSLAQALGIAAPAARVLWTRGYRDAEAAGAFLNPRIEDLYDPRQLLGMEAACERIHQAVRLGEKVLLYGDYDVDGTMSVVLMTKTLELLGGKSGYYVPHRLKEGYGMRPEVIDQAAAEGVKLIVSVDTGIRANAVVEHARALGIDCIVTDHHLPEAEIPPAAAVVNPNQPGCPYPNKDLCGAGVALKLAQALLDASALPRERSRRLFESFLKLTAIATVADVVPLTGENRILVRHGLAGLERTPNPGLRALLDVSGFGAGAIPTARQVGFQIGPRINAAGRMAYAGDVIELLLKAGPDRARAIAAELDKLNRERQETEAAMVQAILKKVEQEPVTDEHAALVFSGEGWHKGVVGIVASRVVDRFCRPAFVLGEDPAAGLATGSGRSVAMFHLLDALESMADLFTKFGGHKQAAGLTLELSRLAEFRQRFQAYAATKLTPEDFIPQIEVDAPVALGEINDRSLRDIWSLAPFGNANHPPSFRVSDVTVAAPPRVVKDQHVFFFIQQGKRTIQVKAWRSAELVEHFRKGSRLDVAITLEEDRYDGWSATLRDFHPLI
jgi:single-stranded-DNA-specific exonuclease